MKHYHTTVDKIEGLNDIWRTRGYECEGYAALVYQYFFETEKEAREAAADFEKRMVTSDD